MGDLIIGAPVYADHLGGLINAGDQNFSDTKVVVGATDDQVEEGMVVYYTDTVGAAFDTYRRYVGPQDAVRLVDGSNASLAVAGVVARKLDKGRYDTPTDIVVVSVRRADTPTKVRVSGTVAAGDQLVASGTNGVLQAAGGAPTYIYGIAVSGKFTEDGKDYCYAVLQPQAL